MYEELLRKRITDLRMSKGLSSRELSLKIGMSASYIGKISLESELFPEEEEPSFPLELPAVVPLSEEESFPFSVEELPGFLISVVMVLPGSIT